MNNPIDLLQAIKDPRQFAMNAAQSGNNQILNNLIQMAQKGDKQGIENFARNLFQGQGMNFDDIMKLFK